MKLRGAKNKAIMYSYIPNLFFSFPVIRFIPTKGETKQYDLKCKIQVYIDLNWS